jgi:hypothetical protein
LEEVSSGKLEGDFLLQDLVYLLSLHALVCLCTVARELIVEHLGAVLELRYLFLYFVV